MQKRLRELVVLAAMTGVLVCPLAPAIGAEQSPIPDFSFNLGAWRMINTNATNYVDPPTGPKPITYDPNYPHVGNLQEGQKTDRVTDIDNPLLLPWAREQIALTNERVLMGRTPFVATSLCWPGGVPTQFLVPTNLFFLQEPDMVTIIWERDHHVRRIYLNQKHSENPAPSWFGESVGHYEGDNTLIVDTIGLSDHALSFVDNFRTPHTHALHVTERWTIADDGSGIEVYFTVEDPGTFTAAWSGLMRYRNASNLAMEEFVCAENNRGLGLDDYNVPMDDTPDF
jgi:hypothetical protein